MWKAHGQGFMSRVPSCEPGARGEARRAVPGRHFRARRGDAQVPPELRSIDPLTLYFSLDCLGATVYCQYTPHCITFAMIDSHLEFGGAGRSRTTNGCG